MTKRKTSTRGKAGAKSAARRRVLEIYGPTFKIIDGLLKFSADAEATAALVEQLLLNIAEHGKCGAIVAVAYAMSKGPNGEARLAALIRKADEAQPPRQRR